MVADICERKAKPSGVDTHKRGGALLIVGDIQALAEGTAGAEPAGEAKKATTAKPEALVPLGARCSRMRSRGVVRRQACARAVA